MVYGFLISSWGNTAGGLLLTRGAISPETVQNLMILMRLSSLLSCSCPKLNLLTPLSSSTVTSLNNNLAFQTHMLLYPMFTVVCDKLTETCTWSFAFSPYSGDKPLPSATCLCAQTGFVSRAGWDRCELGLDKCILFLQKEGGLVGLTGGNSCPTSHQCGEESQRWSETCLG